MTEQFREFKFPEYKEVKRCNDEYIKNGHYKGYQIQIPVIESLFLLIDCQNDSILHMGDDCIRFAWCNKAGFAISSVRYKNCEAGYLAGCLYLLEAANELVKCFELFETKNLLDINKQIQKYNRLKND